ncbi:MAG: DUF4446 family protein [Lachnospiraceae bacterium]|nr:DUF4446 family protein [Lachnospiraceae bacterium]
MNPTSMPVILIITAVLAAALIAVVIVLIIRTKKLSDRLDLFLGGQTGENLEGAILDKFTRIKVLEEKDAVEDKAIRDIYKRLRKTYQKIGTVKYDAYMGNGGSLSFALALLDEDNSGIILNVMNSSDGSYCYLKEIENGRCDIALGREESEALDIAMYAK